jgi:hypothetical protein
MHFMSKYLLPFVLVLLCFASCTKKKGPTKACFTFSKETAKVNDTLYLLNCSENYSKFIWVNAGGFYPGGAILDSINRHQMVVVTSVGTYGVMLRVGTIDGFFSSSIDGSTDVTKTITVNP